MPDYARKTPLPTSEEEQAKAQEQAEREQRHREMLERARLAKARAFAASPEGKATMAALFDQVRGRPVAPLPEAGKPADDHVRIRRYSDAAEVT